MVELTPDQQNGHQPEHDDRAPGYGLHTVTIEGQRHRPSPMMIDYFMRFPDTPEGAWISAGMPLLVANRKRRIRYKHRSRLFGGPDVLADQYDSMAAWAGHDRLARMEGKDVATHGITMLNSMGMQGVAGRMQENPPPQRAARRG